MQVHNNEKWLESLAIILTDALSNVQSPTPIAKTGKPWKRYKHKTKAYKMFIKTIFWIDTNKPCSGTTYRQTCLRFEIVGAGFVGEIELVNVIKKIRFYKE